MTNEPFLIGSGAGFAGDRIDAAQPVVRHIAGQGSGGAIVFETLGERTLALGQVMRDADAEAGYDPLLAEYLGPILPEALASQITLVGNFGSANPSGAARCIGRLCRNLGLHARIAVVHGDDLRASPAIAEGQPWEGDGALSTPEGEMVAANVYLGATPIAEAIQQGADIVVTGRVADPSLVLGPLVARFGWAWADLDRIATGTLVGHLVECGSQVSGGYFADPGFKDVPDMSDIGFPIAEVTADGAFTLTKAPGTGGRIDRRTVTEQLLYEIHDPTAYLTPDVTLDLSEVQVREVGPDRVAVSGARGKPAPERLKATVSYRGEWLGEAEISYAGHNARPRAELAIRTVSERLRMRRLEPRMRADLIGTLSVFDDDAGRLRAGSSCGPDGDHRVRFAFGGSEETVRAATQEVNALYCCGPAGGGGVRISVVPRYVTRSRLVARDAVVPWVEMLETAEVPQ